MEPNEEYVETLMNMGFPNELQIRCALRISKNDMNEAITILTCENPSEYDGFENIDVEMKDVQRSTQSTSTLPPSYDDVVESGYATSVRYVSDI